MNIKFVDNTLSVIMKCLACGKPLQLQPDCKKACSYILSNWTRHVKACKEIVRQRRLQEKTTLHKYFTKVSTSNANVSTSVVNPSNTVMISASELSTSSTSTINTSNATCTYEARPSNTVMLSASELSTLSSSAINTSDANVSTLA